MSAFFGTLLFLGLVAHQIIMVILLYKTYVEESERYDI